MKFEENKEFILEKLKRELPAYLTYHSLEHVMDVYRSAENIAQQEGVTGDDLALLLTATLYHDSGFVRDTKEHERLSCEIAREYLPDYDYNNEQIEIICGMINATKIPQEPNTLCEQIICDADLDYLGRDDFFFIGDKLYTELSTFGVVHNENEWNRLQERFLETHHYFTATSIKLRKAKKEEHLNIVRSKIIDTP